ncbi:hypothetical protein HDE_10880 [Halotydeus destructor]|nr:hypothetical protein HDE_10880 [Halotydeus destructor]
MVYSVIYSVIFVYAMSCSSATSCGKPGYSRRSVLVNIDDREVFAEGFVVEYFCEDMLIGAYTRTCKNGTWSGSIPKCAECLNLFETTATVVANKQIDLKWKNKKKIVGLLLFLRRPSNQSIFPEVDIDQDSGLPSFERIEDRMIESSRLITLATRSPNVRDVSNLDEISVRTRNQIAYCSEKADGSLVPLINEIDGLYLCFSENWYFLFHLDENVDDCDTPDTPVNVRGVSTFRSGTTLHASYKCVEGYRLKLSQTHESPTCSQNGDWTSYDFQPCEKILCNRNETNFVIATVDQSAAYGSHFPIGTKGFLSCSTLQDQRYVVCSENGAWLPATELCGTPFFRNDGLVIGLVSTLGFLVILIPIIGVWLHHCAKRSATDIKIPTRRHDDSANNSVITANSDHEARNHEFPSCENANYYDTGNHN